MKKLNFAISLYIFLLVFQVSIFFDCFLSKNDYHSPIGFFYLFSLPMSNLCMEYALSYLSRYPKTEQEMRILLYRKGYTTEQIKATMETLKKNNFIDDEHYATSYLYSEIIKNGKPVFLIKQKLLQRGIDKGLLDQLIEKQKQEI